MRRRAGFTLIELLVVIAIISILAAVALPSYADYIRRGKIAEAMAGLSSMRVKLEQYYQDNRTYDGACAGGLTLLPAGDAAKYFNFYCTDLAANTYTVHADGRDALSGFNYTIDATGTKSSTIPTESGWAGSGAACWVLKRDGSC